MDGYILKYLYDKSNNPKEKRFLDYFKMLLDYRLCSNGMHHHANFEAQQRKHFEEVEQDKGIKKFLHPRRRVRMLQDKWHSIINQGRNNPQNTEFKKLDQYRYHVLSLLPLSKATIEELNRNGIAVYHYGIPSFIGEVMYESSVLRELDAFVSQLEYKDFNEMLTEANYDTVDSIYQRAVEEFRDVKFDAVFTKTSETLDCKFIIDVFRELGLPSITLQHGLPGPYTETTEGRATYLCVWGEQVWKNYMDAGFDERRVIVTGNSNYTAFPKKQKLRCDTQDVLVITSTPFEVHNHEWEWDKFPNPDRGLLITYLYSVENVLKKIGVRHARLRPHPHHINRQWLAKFIDMSFYEMDNANIISSLSKATLCVGQPSSTMLEAMRYGVSYIVYEPSKDGLHFMNGELLYPPYDGTDQYLKIATTEEQLCAMIKEKYIPDTMLMEEYMQPFNGAIIKQILEEQNN